MNVLWNYFFFFISNTGITNINPTFNVRNIIENTIDIRSPGLDIDDLVKFINAEIVVSRAISIINLKNQVKNMRCYKYLLIF